MDLKALIRNAVVRNSALKFFSLLLAITLWFFVMGEKKAEFSFANVPVVLVNKPDDLLVTRKTAGSVNLRVSGSRSVLTTLSSNTIRAVIDLEGVKPGKTVYKDLIDRVKLPNGTTITSISPAELSVFLETAIRKKVPVHLNLEDGPEEGYEVTNIAIQPEFVEVRLAQSEAGKVKKVMTEALYLSGVQEDIEKELSLVLTGLDLPRSLSTKKVKVSLSINEKMIEKTISDIPVGVVNTTYETTITPSVLDVKVTCPYHLKDELLRETISASIDLEEVKPGKYLKKADIKLPGTVSVIETDPLRFEVVVGKDTKQQ
jgi:hypothetical protein